MNAKQNPRLAAATILASWITEGDFPDRTLGAAEVPDRAFVMEVVYGIARWRRFLEWVIARLAGRKPDDTVLPFLLIGLYQTLLMDDVADHAAVHETVNAAKAGGATHAAGFLNAVLRRSLREKPALLRQREALPLAIRESHPDLLVARWTRKYGESATLDLCRWNNLRPQVTVRPNLARIAMADFVARLQAAGVAAESHPYAPGDFLVLGRGIRVEDLPGYAEGLFMIRDPSTQVAVDLLDPRPGETILDACAAPGGKACGIAERMEDRGVLVAMDLHADRLAPLRENFARMRVGCARVVRGNAAERDAVMKLAETGFDRILLDVPCANTGVLRRRPDARWRFSERRLLDMTKTQRAMLDAARDSLKPGGSLVYSTCSLEPEEGEAMIRDWLAANPGFALRKQIALFPPETKTDGIYAALLAKRETARM
jgi:16S rRNA (cytosine967-C5)-methyltransferase